jgi:ElaB/YqjD/DUF883 family membrane-anchored ribosome-binding protein
MADGARKDTFGYLGCEEMAPAQLLRGLAAALEQLAKSEGHEAVELAHRKARELLDKLEPLIAQSSAARIQLEDKVRQQPLLAIGLAAAAGFLLASLRRR